MLNGGEKQNKNKKITEVWPVLSDIWSFESVNNGNDDNEKKKKKTRS